MKPNRVIFLILIVILFSLTNLHSQIQVLLQQPPPNQLNVTDLWKLTLNNTGKNTYKIYLQGTVDEASDGRIIEATSQSFDLEPGVKNLTANNVQGANVNFKNSRYKEIIARTGNAPSGNYTFCVYAKLENGTEIGEDCKTQIINQLSPPVLISPADGDSVNQKSLMFTWIPPSPLKDIKSVSYTLRVVEILGNQSLNEAIDKNQPIVEQNGIQNTIFQYPPNGIQLKDSHRYGWDIAANINGSIIGHSQPSGFSIITTVHIPDSSGFRIPISPCDTLDNWDFETGDLCGWRAYGNAFENQPTYGNNVISRIPGIILNENLHYWIGTFENRHDLSSPEGGTQGDEPMGALISKKFIINTNYIHFLLGGGHDERRLKVELLLKVTSVDESIRLREMLSREDPSIGVGSWQIKIVDRDTFIVASKKTGDNSERMKRSFFTTRNFIGTAARISIVDSSSADWGHINVDDFRFSDNLPGDIWVTGMEITQSTQTPGNEIPLIGFKKTAVRVYVQSNENGNGPWDNTGAQLTVSSLNGTYEGSPISSHTYSAVNGSYGLITVSQRDTNRNNLEHSYLFILNAEQTAPGQRKLEFKILPPSGSSGSKPEMNPDNDTLSKVITFQDALYYGVYGLLFSDRYDFPSFTPAAPFSNFEQHRKFTENVYPVSRFFIYRYLDNAVRPPTFDSLPDARRWASRIAADNPAPTGTPGCRFYLLQSWNTCSCGLTTNYSEGQDNTGDMSEGRVMAHELGHGLGRQHTPDLCCDPTYGPWDYSTPSPTGAIMRQYGIKTYDGFEVIPPTHWRGNDTTYDFMSYNNPQWISPYTYCGLMNTISGGRIRCASGIERSTIYNPDIFEHITQVNNCYGCNMDLSAGGIAMQYSLNKSSESYIYISGKLNNDGTAFFYPFESLDFMNNATTEAQEKHYKIAFEDRDGKTIDEFLFEPISQDVDKSRSRFFSITLPFNKNTERIKLFRDNKEIASRSKSPNIPVLDISSLSGLTELKGIQTLSWSGTDADGDHLIYSIDYSTDNGNSWMPLRVLLSSPLAEINADYLPGTTQGLLRVKVSDGFNTVSSQINHVINVSKKNPEITLLPLITSGNESRPLIAEASAFDSEDGSITNETSYIWTSDKDGEIAKGHWAVLTNLSSGKHILTITATDSDGNKTSASTEVIIPDKK